ncbi:hypothetical protein ACFX1Z_018491 [Malus domestica]
MQSLGRRLGRAAKYQSTSIKRSRSSTTRDRDRAREEESSSPNGRVAAPTNFGGVHSPAIFLGFSIAHLTTRLGKKSVVDGGDGGYEVGKPSEGKGLGGKGLEGTRDLRFTKAEVRRFQAVVSNLCEFRKRKWKRKIKMKKEEERKKRDRRAEKRKG